MPVLVRRLNFLPSFEMNFFEMLKSINFTIFVFGSIKTLSGLMSLWHIPSWWIYYTALSNCLRISVTSDSRRRPVVQWLMWSSNEMPLAYSMIMISWPLSSSWIISNTFVIWGWFKSFKISNSYLQIWMYSSSLDLIILAALNWRLCLCLHL